MRIRSVFSAPRRPHSASASPAHAQTFPNRPITLVIPFTPGGSTTIVGRGIADKMSELLGEKIVVDNRPGAGGTIGTRAVAKSDPDGYTLLLGYTGTLAIGPSLYKNVGYDPRKDFAPIGLIGNAPNSLVVNPSFPAKTVAELIAYAKANPGKVNFGSAGAGTASHITGEYFAARRRHHAGAYPLQGHRSRADRSAGRAYPDGVRADPGLAQQCRGGQAAGARGDQRDALEPVARGADHRRIRPVRIRRLAVLRPGGAGRHAAAGHRQAQQGAARRARPPTRSRSNWRWTVPRSPRARRKTMPPSSTRTKRNGPASSRPAASSRSEASGRAVSGLTSTAFLLNRSHAHLSDLPLSWVPRARAAADGAAGGGHRCRRAAAGHCGSDGAGGVAAGDRGISPQAQGISGGARGVRAGSRTLLDLDCRKTARPQRQAARAPGHHARRLCPDPAAAVRRAEAAGGSGARRASPASASRFRSSPTS